MLRFARVALAVSLLISLSACSSNAGTTSPSNTAAATPDAALVPPKPDASVVETAATTYADGLGDYVFKVGDGPSWCTVTPDANQVICEQNEAAASYPPVPAPADCAGSYGYQIRLWGAPPQAGKTAEFVCATGQWQDPAKAKVLPSGKKISVGNFSCYVKETAARCENSGGQYIALGPRVWAIQN